MAFSLRTTRDNQLKLFSMKKILEIIGEDINDEINIDGKAYLLSSFVDLGGNGGGGSTYIWNTTNLVVSNNGQIEFYLSNIISDFSNTRLYINGVHYEYGITKSYHIIGRTLLWHGGFELGTGDEIYLKYITSI